MFERPQSKRDVLPIPDITPVGLTTYDAKDPATSFPPIEPLRPPEGAPNVLIVLLDDVGLRRLERLRRPDQHADRRAARGERAEVQPLPHDRAVLPDARSAADRPQPPHRRHGRHHRDRDVGARLQLDPPEHVRAAGRDAEAERLLDGAVRQVPRGAGLGDEPDGAVPRLADRQRASSTSTASSAARPTSTTRRIYEGTVAGRAGEDARRGLPLHGRHDRQGDRVGPPAEGAHAGQAVLRLLRPRRDARAAPRHAGVGRQVQGRVRRRLGRAARADLRPAEGARRDPRRTPS